MSVEREVFVLIAFNILFLVSNQNIKAQSLPNIVVILTDDQDVVLNGMVPSDFC